MESLEATSRRMRCIASHLAATPQSSCSSSLATVVCSSSTGSQSSSRKDGMLLYARQQSHVPAYLKEIRHPEGSNAGSTTQATSRKDSRLMFARQGSHTQPYFMREHAETQVVSLMERDNTCTQRLQSKLDNSDNFDKVSSDLGHYGDKMHDTYGEPLFARPSFDGGDGQHIKEPNFKEFQTSEVDWCPRMDITESKAAYVVFVELPGVNADCIRVEVNNDRLLVSGSRSMDSWIDNSKQSKEAFFLRRELPQGRFRAQWSIPKNSNIDSISAEFMDGFLQIHVPKNAL